jgi:hypothetical protein
VKLKWDPTKTPIPKDRSIVFRFDAVKDRLQTIKDIARGATTQFALPCMACWIPESKYIYQLFF